jgi:hypothetical protein
MNEVLTKRFWQGVKRTFDEALADRPPEDNASQAIDPSNPNASSTAEAPSAPPASRVQDS